jgi:hypothetical protein
VVIVVIVIKKIKGKKYIIDILNIPIGIN